MFNIKIQNVCLNIEYAQLFAALIARTAKDVDVLIDSLPSEESTAALQVSTFQTFLPGADSVMGKHH